MTRKGTILQASKQGFSVPFLLSKISEYYITIELLFLWGMVFLAELAAFSRGKKGLWERRTL